MSTIRKPEPDSKIRTLPQSIASEKKPVTTTADRIVRPPEAALITGRSLATIWRDEQAGTFPQKIRIGSNSVGYRLSSLMDWLDSREIVTGGKPPSAPGRKPSAAGGK